MVGCPADGADVIDEVEEDREWVTVMAISEESSDGRSVVNDDCGEFQDIDRDKVAVRVARDEQFCLLVICLGPSNMSPKFQLDAEANSAVETCVVKSDGVGHSQYNMAKRGLPGDT